MSRLEAYCIEVLVREVIEIVHRFYFAPQDGSNLLSEVRLQKLANLIHEYRYIVGEEPIEVMLSPLVLSHDFGSDFLVPIERSLFIMNLMPLKAD